MLYFIFSTLYYFTVIVAAEFDSEIPVGLGAEEAKGLCQKRCDDKGSGIRGSFVSFGKCFCDDKRK